MIPRCFVDRPLAVGEVVTLPRETGRYLTQVLRLAAGDPLVLLDGSGTEFPAALAAAGKAAVCRVLAAHPNQAEPATRALLVQGLPKGEKFDLIVQKATELGVYAIRPLLSERSQVRWHCDRAAGKLARWQAIAREAAEQSERGRIPEVRPPATWPELWRALPAPAHLLCFHARGGEPLRLATAAIGPAPAVPVALFVGPEGGWSEAEVADMQARGARLVSQGPRILRAETAALAALAVVMHDLEPNSPWPSPG